MEYKFIFSLWFGWGHGSWLHGEDIWPYFGYYSRNMGYWVAVKVMKVEFRLHQGCPVSLAHLIAFMDKTSQLHKKGKGALDWWLQDLISALSWVMWSSWHILTATKSKLLVKRNSTFKSETWFSVRYGWNTLSISRITYNLVRKEWKLIGKLVQHLQYCRLCYSETRVQPKGEKQP